MPLARSNSREADESLPDPQLNPLVNPRLGKNLGRWANVYYTTAPERRDQAVLELVRELEDTASPATLAQASDSGPADDLRMGSHDDNATASFTPHRFCYVCGSPVESGACSEHQRKASPVRTIPQARVKDHATGPQPVEPKPAKAESDGRATPKTQLILILLISALLTAWSVRQDRALPAPQAVSAAPALPATSPTTPPSTAVLHEPAPVAPVAPARLIPRPLPGVRKPSAGKPMECSSEHLKNCPVGELYRRTMTLAAGIDSLFVAYDKRMAQLTRDASRHIHDSARQRQGRLRQANVSAQVWEHVQLASYATHEKNEALRYRAELGRRLNGSGGDQKRLVAYKHPQSCLDLHYIAKDLRRLAGGLPGAQVVSRASVNRGIRPPLRQR